MKNPLRALASGVSQLWDRRQLRPAAIGAAELAPPVYEDLGVMGNDIIVLKRDQPRCTVLFVYPIDKYVDRYLRRPPTPATVAGIVNPELADVLDADIISALDKGEMAYEIRQFRPFEVNNAQTLRFLYETERRRFSKLARTVASKGI